jgi:hypothetical protein
MSKRYSSSVPKRLQGVQWNSFSFNFNNQWLHFVFMGFLCVTLETEIISLNSINQMIFVMVKCGVLFQVRTGFLNII